MRHFVESANQITSRAARVNWDFNLKVTLGQRSRCLGERVECAANASPHHPNADDGDGYAREYGQTVEQGECAEH